MGKLKMATSFIKIKLHKIGNLLIKTAGTYVVSGFAVIQVSSIVVDNVSTQAILGLKPEVFMQYLFIVIIIGFPLILISTYIYKRNTLNDSSLESFDELNKNLSNKKPKIGIMPFENLNNDSDGAFLVDGIVEDLITELSMVKEISVATRKTCFGFKGKDYTSEAFKQEWGFDYVVSGSIRSSDDRLRISVELSDMEDDEVVWSSKYDKVKSDIFDLQDEIVTKVITCVVGEIEITSLKRAHRKPTENMTSYEYTLKGRALNQKFQKEANDEALIMLDAAIEADSLNPLPHSWKACTLGQRMFMGWDDNKDESMGNFLETLSKANEMNDNDWNTNRILAEAHLTLNDFAQTKVYAAKAFKANPSNPHVLSIYGDALLRNNEVKNAIKIFEKMYELEPIVASDTNSDRPLQSIFFAYYLNNDFDKCLELFNQIEECNARTWISLVDIYKQTKKDHSVESWFTSGLNRFSDVDWKTEIKGFHLNDKDMKNNYLDISASLS
ncbi:hypothetical protein OAE05_03290 [Gammaproteobacteria bacterium]|nr:hypothetical protein [Gammaproteobacteria bacterium]|tara:strand:- start:2253 stop:3746 length:1494 start_codon:yes stop_codon:yes gene_type:complete